MPHVTVLLTSYNHEQFLHQAIKSVLEQTYTDWELLIVDDCSVDTSWNIICGYHDARIMPIRNSVRMGPERAFQVMQELACGEYIAVFHSDDMWLSTKLEKQVEFLDTHRDIGAVFTAVDIIDADGNIRDQKIQDTYSDCFATENHTRYEWLRYFFYNGNALCHPSVLIRKCLYSECGLFVNGLAQGPDFFKWIRLCMTNEIYILPDRLTRYRVLQSQGNTSSNTLQNRVRSSLELQFIYDPYFELSMDSLLKVFPNSIKYVVNQEYNVQFAMAHIFIEEGSCTSMQLLGIRKLYCLLNDAHSCAQIERIYGYGFLQYVEEAKHHNIFNLCCDKFDSKLQENQVIIYWRNGDVFVPENSVSINYTLSDQCIYDVHIDLPEPLFTALRVDVCQWHAAIAKIIKFECDGEDCLDALQSGAQIVGAVDIFACLRPQYFFYGVEPRKIKQIHLSVYLTNNLQMALEQWQAFAPEKDLDALQMQATPNIENEQGGLVEKDLIIVGSGKFARETVWMLKRINENVQDNKWNLLGYVDDTIEKQGAMVCGYSVLGTVDKLLSYEREVYVIMPMGTTEGRKQLVKRLEKASDVKYATIISSSAVVGENFTVGEGSLLCENTLCTVDVTIGKHSIVNVGSTLSHDVVIGDYVTISPGVTICGNCVIGNNVFIGAGSTIIEQCKIADGVIIGAGATVIRDILLPGTYVGTPAYRLVDKS